MDLQLKPVQPNTTPLNPTPLKKPVSFNNPVQFNSAQLNSRLNKKVDLFLNQAAIKKSRVANLKQKILDYLAHNDRNKYVLFRHSSLYFFVDNAVKTVETTVDNFTETNYLRFDGEKVTRIDPEYYLGQAKKVESEQCVVKWCVGHPLHLMILTYVYLAR